MDYFRLVSVIEGPLVLFVDQPLAGSVSRSRYCAAAVAPADDLDGEMIDRHFSPARSLSPPHRGAVIPDLVC